MKLTRKELAFYVEENIGEFHGARLKSLAQIQLQKIIRRKNPYLFKAKNILTAQDLVKNIFDAHLSSQEETMFGGFLEDLAIFVNQKVFKGRKSAVRGIDLEFEKSGVKYLIAIKSGPNWGNSGQVVNMRNDFKNAKRTLATTKKWKTNVVAVNGCCYGKEPNSNKGDYLKLCGQDFWELISGEKDFYLKIVEPLGYKAKEKNDIFLKEYSRILNLLTLEFGKEFCQRNGAINWNKLVKLNSAKGR